MNAWQKCSDVRDAVPLYKPIGLYLKPAAFIHISVQLPQLKPHGKAISNWEIIEKLKQWAEPEEFLSLKVTKSTLEFIRLEGEIENKSKLASVLSHFDGKSIKVSGFTEQLKIRAAEVKPDYPCKHDWDSFFRDSKDMNEMKAGERPDTIYLGNLPCKWFSSESSGNKPNEGLLRRIFEQYGEVTRIDIPMLDPFRNQMNSHISGVKQFTFNQSVIFEAYIQFKEYFCFVKAMDAFRGKKLLYMDEERKAFTASIKVNFDKSKHLSDASIRRRQIVRERLEKKEKERLEKEMKETEEAEKKKEDEMQKKLERRKLREEKRKQKELEKLKLKEVEDINKKIAVEEYLLLMAQRKLESIRLLGELINRVKNEKQKELSVSGSKEKKRRKNKAESLINENPVTKKIKTSAGNMEVDAEKDLRYKLIKKFKKIQEQQISKEKTKLKSLVSEASELSNNAANISSVSSDTSPDNEQFSNRRLNSHNDYYDSFNNSSHRRSGRSSFRKSMRGRGDNSYHNNSYQGSNDFHNNRGRFQRGRSNFGGRYNNSWRGAYQGQYMMPFMDPMLLSYSHKYYKYLQKIARDSQRSRRSSRSRSYSRSTSRSYSRSRSRSRSRSHSRSYSRSYSRSKSRSRSRSSKRWSSRSRSRERRTHDETRVEGKNEQTTNAEVKLVVNSEATNTVMKKPKEKKSKKHKKKKKKHKSDKKETEKAHAESIP